MSNLKIIEAGNDQAEHEVSREIELRQLLNKLLREEPRVVILEIPKTGIFTLGVGLPYGFVQYSKSGEPPYLIASDRGNTESINLDEEVEFDSNGTPTPIPIYFCLPYNRIVDIVVHFFIRDELPSFVKWEEI